VVSHNAEAASVRLALDIAYEGWQDWAVAQGLPAFRAEQVWRWLHVQGASPQEMTNLPQTLRQGLLESFNWQPLTFVAKHASADRSVKFVWRTRAGNPVESVWMPSGAGGNSACLSSHSGCGLGCRFCQTGRLGWLETLSAGQILAQLYQTEKAAGAQAERIVLMGMGEPLLNLGAVRQAVAALCHSQGRAWAPRRITISTAGLAQPIEQMAESFPPVSFALSLHFTQPAQRKQFMPKAESNLERLALALAHYRARNGGKITVEYMLLAGLNHTEADARRLAQFTRQVTDGSSAQTAASHAPVLLNLLTYNPVACAPELKAASEAQLNQFAQWLADLHQSVTIRRSRGQDIAAACGQLGSVHL
jgi:23S rRNA (adenine2503-C2)-methyltransferase